MSIHDDIQAVIDTSDHLVLLITGIRREGRNHSAPEPDHVPGPDAAKGLRFFRYAHFHANFYILSLERRARTPPYL